MGWQREAKGELIKKHDDVDQDEERIDGWVAAPRVEIFEGDEHSLKWFLSTAAAKGPARFHSSVFSPAARGGIEDANPARGRIPELPLGEAGALVMPTVAPTLRAVLAPGQGYEEDSLPSPGRVKFSLVNRRWGMAPDAPPVAGPGACQSVR